jgi:acyl-CoA reductase-like NAD-dependent aldehyde dehydrogenase
MAIGSIDRDVTHRSMFIDGRSEDATERLEVHNPAHPSHVVGTIPRGSAAHVDRAIAAANKAQAAWAAQSFFDRASILGRALESLADYLGGNAALFVRENGKTLAEAKGELFSIIPRQRLALSFAKQLDEERAIAGPNGQSLITARPYGVVVSIVPWNAPLSLAFTQVVAAALAGNCVVLKPPESCPLTIIGAMEIFAATLPAGVLNVVTGLPTEIGDALTTHELVGKIGFTGSIPSARHIMSNAAKGIKGVTLELGGNDPAIVLDDMNFSEPSIRAMISGTFPLAGQVCMAIKRIFVPRPRIDEFVCALCKYVDEFVVGDGLVEGVTMGPLHTRSAKERAEALLSDSRKRGGEVRLLGKIDDEETFSEGHFMRPAVVTCLVDDARLVIEEQFCAAIPVCTYDDLDEAITRANKSEYGLSASVWGKSPEKALAVAKRIDAGQVWLNAHGVAAINHMTAYGGIKQSGIGCRSGIDGIREYMQVRVITAREF